MPNLEYEITYMSSVENIENCLTELEKNFFHCHSSKKFESKNFSIEIVLLPFLERKEKLVGKFIEDLSNFKLSYKIKERRFDKDVPFYKEKNKKKFGKLIYNGFSTNSIYVKETYKKTIDDFVITRHSITPVFFETNLSFSETYNYIEFESNNGKNIEKLQSSKEFSDIISRNELQSITYEQNKINISKTKSMFLVFKQEAELQKFLNSIKNEFDLKR